MSLGPAKPLLLRRRASLRAVKPVIARWLAGLGVVLLAWSAPLLAAPPEWVQSLQGLEQAGPQVLLAQHPRRFVRVAKPTVWEAVSNLAAYRGMLYLVGSTIYVNHNSADVYRYDPRRDKTRFEARLFSQDAGQPAVFNGLLYYPAEDSRFSAGVGELYVTDGKAWRWLQMPGAPAIHVHALAAHGGRLYAGAARWNGLLYDSAGGRRWSLRYSHPTPEGRVTRINGLLPFKGDLYAAGYSVSMTGRYLFRLRDGTLRPVGGVPEARWVRLLAAFGGRLYFSLVGGERPGLYRHDGVFSERIALPKKLRFTSGAVWRERLYLAGRLDKVGVLWSTTDGEDLAEAQAFPDREPVGLAPAQGRLFVGMRRQGRPGELWASATRRSQGVLRTGRLTGAPPHLTAHAPPGTAVEYQPVPEGGTVDSAEENTPAFLPWPPGEGALPRGPYRLRIRLRGDQFRTPYLAWAEPAPTPAPPLPAPVRPRFSPGEIAARLEKLAGLKTLPEFWAVRPLVREMRDLGAAGDARVARWIRSRLGAEYPPDTVPMFGGGPPVAAAGVIRHYLLMGLALGGQGRVPPGLWEGPFAHSANGAEKFYAPHEAAVFAAGQLRQSDGDTLRSLGRLLVRQDLPLWFKGDVVGALTRITGRRFGYDFGRWRDWLAATGNRGAAKP